MISNFTASASIGIGRIAMLSIHSSPVGDLGTRDNGGMSVYIRELARELGNSGVFVDVFTLCQNQPVSSIIPMFKNVRLIRLNVRLKHLDIQAGQKITKKNLFDYLPAVFAAFNETFEKEGLTYDLVHSHYWLSGVLGRQIKQVHGMPHITTFHTMGAVKNRACSQESEPASRIEQEKELAADCDRIVASTQNETHDLISMYHVAAEKIGVVPAGVNLALFQPVDKAAARREIGFNDDAQLLLYIGRNVPVKGLARLLKIMSAVNSQKRAHHWNQNRDQTRFRLLVVGGDDDNEKLISVIRNLKIQKAVNLIGRKDQELLPAYYSAADMLVVPSYHESFCLAGLESLACGTPVVSTPVGAMPEIINHKNGCVIAEENDREMVKAIIKVAGKQQKGLFDAKQIRESVQGYAWANPAKLMIKEYQKLLAH